MAPMAVGEVNSEDGTCRQNKHVLFEKRDRMRCFGSAPTLY